MDLTLKASAKSIDDKKCPLALKCFSDQLTAGFRGVKTHSELSSDHEGLWKASFKVISDMWVGTLSINNFYFQ